MPHPKASKLDKRRVRLLEEIRQSKRSLENAFRTENITY